jgi:quercetin dioxygenase-like cupin family protein
VIRAGPESACLPISRTRASAGCAHALRPFKAAARIIFHRSIRRDLMSHATTAMATWVGPFWANAWVQFSVPKFKVLNSNQSFGPAVAILRMEPGSEIPRHLHEQTIETSYVLDGDFINEGTSYPKGTEFNIKPNAAHGPHTTRLAAPSWSHSATHLLSMISSWPSSSSWEWLLRYQ